VSGRRTYHDVADPHFVLPPHQVLDDGEVYRGAVGEGHLYVGGSVEEGVGLARVHDEAMHSSFFLTWYVKRGLVSRGQSSSSRSPSSSLSLLSLSLSGAAGGAAGGGGA